MVAERRAPRQFVQEPIELLIGEQRRQQRGGGAVAPDVLLGKLLEVSLKRSTALSSLVPQVLLRVRRQ
ncbi:MAG TPA: hypothetical protein VG013_26880 [Gemmataceae bacterium]|jgi:hypothetical protein|nr:hypothetical protein [Gemmataceae bacterium]